MLRRTALAGILGVTMVVELFAMPIPPQVKQCVAFIFGKLPNGKVSAGTGFFVGVKGAAHADRYYVYLITARHVLQLPDGKGYLAEVFVRLNKRDGSSDTIRIPMVRSGDKRTVYFPRDDSTDLAAIPMVPDQKVYEYLYLPDSMIVTRDMFKKIGVSEGSDVFFTGLFTPHIGEKRNDPIVRFGRVALVTPQQIQWQGSKIDLYLMETASFGGNSGSPVFFYLGADRVPGSLVVGQPELYLAGVMKGTFNEQHPIETADPPKSVESLGIAAVVPAYQLHELLFGPELSALRK
ncbi:MAG: trypsin-like peptidase domain-containing protein [Acidobacteriota bacterium]